MLDLEWASAELVGRGAVHAFLGGKPSRMPAEYALASPIRLVPTGVPSVLVHGDADVEVPVEISRRYHRQARAGGDACELIELPGSDHFGVIDVASPDWQVCRAAVLDLLGLPEPGAVVR